MKKIIVSRFFLMVLAVCLSVGTTWAQERVLTGKVFDVTTSEAMPGASVVIKGTTIGATTDLDGNFQINVSDGQTVVVSFVGYLNEEIVMSGQTSIEVQLTPELTELTEIVVVGYGTQKAKEVTGSVASVKAEDFNDGNISDPAQLIQGKVAGLSISKPGGDPNASYNIRLRGLSTFGANTEPLIVVDGMQGVPLNSVDPNDIASMDVLKDASAAAIYGTRGASGVIIITTKQGKKGDLDAPVNVEYSGSVTTTSIAKYPEVLTKEEFLSIPGSVSYDSLSTYETDWAKEITQVGIAQTHNLSLSGASNKATYNVSMNYRNNEGVVINNGFQQYGGRINLSQKTLQDMLTFDINLAASSRTEDYVDGEAIRSVYRYNPTYPVYEDNPQYGGYSKSNLFDFYNPVALANQRVSDGKKNSFVTNFKVTLEPITGLKLSASYSQDHQNELYGEYYSMFHQNATYNGTGRGRRESKYFFKQQFESLIAYSKQLGELNSTILAGYSYREEVNEGHWGRSYDYLSDNWEYNALDKASRFDAFGDNSNVPVGSWKNSNELVGFFGRLSLAYSDTYFAQAQFREDGSSKFGENNKWAPFWGASAGVDVSKFIETSWLSRAKIRGGYGTTGNLPRDSYLSKETWGPTGYVLVGGEYVQAYGGEQEANPDLQWEIKKELTIGLDYALLNYRLNGSIEFYRSLSEELILQYFIPSTGGGNLYDYKWLNAGTLSNSGMEFTASYDVIKNQNFKWNTSFNMTYYINATLEEITHPDIAEGTTYQAGQIGAPNWSGQFVIEVKPGESIGNIIGSNYLGIINDTVRYETVGDSVNGQLVQVPNEDYVLGNGLPDFQFGWGNTFNYKQFDLSFFFRGVFGHSLVNVNNMHYGSNPTAINVQSGTKLMLDMVELYYQPGWNEQLVTSHYVEKADFITLDNFALGYTWSSNTNKYFSKIRAYVAGQNLFTLTNYSGITPEVRFVDSGDNNNPLAPGLDRGDTYFRTRSFTLGVNVTF